jgi:hypothetical protein
VDQQVGTEVLGYRIEGTGRGRANRQRRAEFPTGRQDRMVQGSGEESPHISIPFRSKKTSDPFI